MFVMVVVEGLLKGLFIIWKGLFKVLLDWIGLLLKEVLLFEELFINGLFKLKFGCWNDCSEFIGIIGLFCDDWSNTCSTSAFFLSYGIDGKESKRIS